LFSDPVNFLRIELFLQRSLWQRWRRSHHDWVSRMERIHWFQP